MEYQVVLKAPHDMMETDYASGIALCEERNGYKYGIWFSSLEEAKNACTEHKGYAVIDSEELDCVWHNPNYKSNSIIGLQKYLGKILLPH